MERSATASAAASTASAIGKELMVRRKGCGEDEGFYSLRKKGFSYYWCDKRGRSGDGRLRFIDVDNGSDPVFAWDPRSVKRDGRFLNCRK